MEKLRLSLIRWNVAPLAVVVFMMLIMGALTRFILNQPCGSLDPVYASGLFGLIGGIGLILQKMYASMQTNRDLDNKEE